MTKTGDDIRPQEIRRRRTWLIFLGSFFVPVFLVILFLFAINFRTLWPVEPIISVETTRITGPLKSDGRQVDYFAAIEEMYYTPEMKTEANGFREIVATYGAEVFFPYDSPDEVAVLSEQVYEKLGLEPVINPRPFFSDPYDFLVRYAEDNNLDSERLTDILFFEDWEPSQLPMLKEWLEDADPVLGFYSEQLKKDVFIFPLTRMSEDDPLYSSHDFMYHIHRMGRIFLARAKFRLHEGDMDGAIDDRIACMRLGGLVKKCPFLSIYRWGIRLEMTASQIAVATGNNKPNKQQILRLRKAVAGLPEPCEEEKVIETFRYFFLDEIQNIRDGKTSDDRIGENLIFHHDWNLVMLHFNNKLDFFPNELERLLKETNRRATFFDSLFPTFRADVTSNWFARDIEPELNYYYFTANLKISCQYRMNDIVLAMLLYNEEHGTLPPAWTTEENGRPLHSWRVLILPYLGQNELYEKIRLEEPWDSEYNSQFHKVDIPFYKCPAFEPPLGPGETSYTVVFGENLAFGDSDKGKLFEELGPESDQMVLVVERKTSVNWMRPDREIAKSEILRTENNIFSSHHSGGDYLNLGMRNGTCTSWYTSLSSDEIENILEGKELVYD